MKLPLLTRDAKRYGIRLPANRFFLPVTGLKIKNTGTAFLTAVAVGTIVGTLAKSELMIRKCPVDEKSYS
jgi:hypothetical protein